MKLSIQFRNLTIHEKARFFNELYGIYGDNLSELITTINSSPYLEDNGKTALIIIGEYSKL